MAGLLTWVVGLALVASAACAPGSDSSDDFAEISPYTTQADLPTFPEDLESADADVLTARLEQIGDAVEEVALRSAAASTAVETAAPEPIRLAMSEEVSSVAAGGISARDKQKLLALTSDLKIDTPFSTDLLLAALIPSVTELQAQRESIPTSTLAIITADAAGDGDPDGSAGEEEFESEVLDNGDDTAQGGTSDDQPAGLDQENSEPEEPTDETSPWIEDTPSGGIPGRTSVADDDVVPEVGVVVVGLSGSGHGFTDIDLRGPHKAPGKGDAHGSSKSDDDEDGPDDSDATPGKSGAANGKAVADDDEDGSDDPDATPGKSGATSGKTVSDEDEDWPDDPEATPGTNGRPTSTGNGNSKSDDSPGGSGNVNGSKSGKGAS